VSDTLAFIESLYGRKFKAVEGGAFPLDKVYRTAGGGLSVSETRLSVSVHPRFELRLSNVAGGGSGLLTEAPTTTALKPFSRAIVSGREQYGAARHGTNIDSRSFQSYPTTLYQTISSVTFTLLQQRAQFGAPQTATLLRAAAARGGSAAPSLTAHSWNVLPVTPASVRLTSLDLRGPVVHAPRQEFVSILLKTYLHAVEARECLSVRTTEDSSGAPLRLSTAQAETGRRFTHAPRVAERQPTWRTYTTPTTRQQPGGTVEVRRELREFRAAETVKEHATAPHASAREPRPTLLQVLSPASLMSSLSEDFPTVLAEGAGGLGLTTYDLSGRAPARSLQQLRTRTTPTGTREVAAAVHAPRLHARTPRHQTPRPPTGTREVLSSIHTFVGSVHQTFAPITHAGYSTVFKRPGFGPGEFARPASVAEFRREASTQDVGARIRGGRAPWAFSTRPVSTQGASGEARAERPEGMALELIRQRREEVLRLPQPGYVFTQPARAQLEERQVITKASREEIVEVVRKEVRALGAAAPAPAAAARADLAGLADEVYSTLVRRLTVEKERLGRL
jgi:hypothetical protein